MKKYKFISRRVVDKDVIGITFEVDTIIKSPLPDKIFKNEKRNIEFLYDVAKQTFRYHKDKVKPADYSFISSSSHKSIMDTLQKDVDYKITSVSFGLDQNVIRDTKKYSAVPYQLLIFVDHNEYISVTRKEKIENILKELD